jgi:sporulation protein YlmC with PRC-barrel domain
MPRLPSSGVLTLAAALLLAPAAFAQSDATKPEATKSDQPGASQPAIGTTTPETTTETTTPATTKATVESPSGTLGVASVKLEHGRRASKLIGTAVYNDQNQKIGSIDDLILTNEDKVVVAVIQVGGFLGMGGKLVAVPYSQLRLDNDKAVITGADKNALNSMPTFTYNAG